MGMTWFTIIYAVFGVGFAIWWVVADPYSERGARRHKLEIEERERERQERSKKIREQNQKE